MWEQFLKVFEFFQKKGEVVRQDPMFFIGVAVICFIAGFGVATWHYSEHIAVLEDETKTMSPEAMAKLIGRVDALEARVSTAIVPRTLSDHAKEMIKTGIARSKFKYDQIPIFSTPDAESITYAQNFAAFLKTIGVANGFLFSTPAPLDQCGVMVGVPNVDHPSEHAADFFFILDSANLKPKYTKGPGMEFDLFIGPPCPSSSDPPR
jgi:hypothetical protein